MRKMTEPLVSVVIPTFNSERFLESCLKSIKAQRYSKIEVIVVDNYSSDSSRKIAQKYGKVLLKGPERSSQRNFGAENAKGDYLFFVDSDMKLSPSVIEECIVKLREVDAVIIPEISVGEGFWTKCKALERSCYVGDDTIEAARFFRKDVFLKVGCFDMSITGQEDWDLHQRICKAGFRVARTNSFIWHHEGKLTLQKTMLKKHNYGKTLKLYATKHPKEARAQSRLIRPAFIKNWRRLAKDPVHASGMLFMKVCEFTAAWAGSFDSEAKSL